MNSLQFPNLFWVPKTEIKIHFQKSYLPKDYIFPHLWHEVFAQPKDNLSYLLQL